MFDPTASRSMLKISAPQECDQGTIGLFAGYTNCQLSEKI
jgi:hypothetical protein